ncbi:Glutathione synthetase [Rhodotorula toruloides]
MAGSAWPPKLSEEHEQHVLAQAADWALAHGLVLRPLDASTASAIHAPYSLFPSPFPRHLFEEAKRLQPLYNDLYARITADDAFLEQVVGGAVSKVDEFQGRLYEIWKQVKKEGIKQPLALGLFRSDYLIHAPEGTSLDQYEIKQVEFNTISSSFGALSSRVTELHRYLGASGAYPAHPDLNTSTLPQNAALSGLASGLAAAHTAYRNSKAIVLMVTQDNERNAFDQRPLEYELIAKHGIGILRIPFSQLRTTLSLDPTTYALLYTPSSPVASLPSPLEIALVYYRTAYAPTDYYTPAEWDTRLLIERSKAIKCPSVGMQLAGAKKIQEVLASRPEALERFLKNGKDRDELRRTFTGLYPMDDSELGKEALRKAYEESERFVLKPQREGGGNNIYRGDIPPFLDRLAEEDKRRGIEEQKGAEARGEGVEAQPRGREGYILMSLIEPPKGMEQVLVKAGEDKGRRADVVSELGIYGVVLLRENVDEAGAPPEVLVNETVGHLLRTKGRESDEGGVAVGFSVIDSPMLTE